MASILVAGHICLDITPVLHNRLEALQPGTLLRVGEADVHTGGCVANTGLAMKLLGADVRLLGKVGRDAFGDLVAGILAQYGADRDLLRDEHSSTSYSVVIAPPDVDRVFLHHPGANETFAADDVSDDALRGAKLLHFGYPPLMTRMIADDGRELRLLFQRAKALGLATSLDMAAVDPATPAGKADWRAILRGVLPLVDFFVPSAEEICYMLHPELHTRLTQAAGDGGFTDALDVRRDIAPLADELLAMGAQVVLIKCGAPGLYVRSAPDVCLPWAIEPAQWNDFAAFQSGYRAKRVLSATGAGDTSIAAFLVSALQGQPLAHCARRAAMEGACCVEAYDALGGVQPLAELDKRIAHE